MIQNVITFNNESSYLEFSCLVHDFSGWSDDKRCMFTQAHIHPEDLGATRPFLYSHDDKDVLGVVSMELDERGLIGHVKLANTQRNREYGELIKMGAYGVSCGITFFNTQGQLMSYSEYSQLKPTDSYSVRFNEVSLTSVPADKGAIILETKFSEQEFINAPAIEKEQYVDVDDTQVEQHADIEEEDVKADNELIDLLHKLLDSLGDGKLAEGEPDEVEMAAPPVPPVPPKPATPAPPAGGVQTPPATPENPDAKPKPAEHADQKCSSCGGSGFSGFDPEDKAKVADIQHSLENQFKLLTRISNQLKLL